MKFIIIFVIGVLVGIRMGNLDGDQATLRDCATSGHASMKGGGSIDCKVQVTN